MLVTTKAKVDDSEERKQLTKRFEQVMLGIKKDMAKKFEEHVKASSRTKLGEKAHWKQRYEDMRADYMTSMDEQYAEASAKWDRHAPLIFIRIQYCDRRTRVTVSIGWQSRRGCIQSARNFVGDLYFKYLMSDRNRI